MEDFKFICDAWMILRSVCQSSSPCYVSLFAYNNPINKTHLDAFLKTFTPANFKKVFDKMVDDVNAGPFSWLA